MAHERTSTHVAMPMPICHQSKSILKHKLGELSSAGAAELKVPLALPHPSLPELQQHHHLFGKLYLPYKNTCGDQVLAPGNTEEEGLGVKQRGGSLRESKEVLGLASCPEKTSETDSSPHLRATANAASSPPVTFSHLPPSL